MTVTDNIANTTTNYTYNLDQLNQYTGIQINSNPVQSLNYDYNFNLTGYNGWAYIYDAENRITSISGNGHSPTSTYDDVGLCVERLMDEATTLLTYDQC